MQVIIMHPCSLEINMPASFFWAGLEAGEIHGSRKTHDDSITDKFRLTHRFIHKGKKQKWLTI